MRISMKHKENLDVSGNQHTNYHAGIKWHNDKSDTWSELCI